MPSTRHVIVYGGAGALGAAVIKEYKKNSWTTTNIDLNENSEATNNVIVDTKLSFIEQAENIIEGVKAAKEKADAIICVAGGWAGGNAASSDFLKNSELMWVQSGQSSLVAARLASLYLKPGGLLTLTGASAALNGATPGMIGYGMVKSAVFHLVSSLAAQNGGLPDGAKVNAILPVTLDTPMNRKFMADADKSTWTPMDVVARKLLAWSENPAENVLTGELVEIITTGGKTEFVSSSKQ